VSFKADGSQETDEHEVSSEMSAGDIGSESESGADIVSNRNTGSLDPGLPGTGLQRRIREGEGKAEARPGLPTGEGKDQLESGRDGGNMIKDKEESIRDVMQEDQRPTKGGDCQFIHYNIV
jgi:hypothetical protein